jgi:HprK-related kinase A
VVERALSGDGLVLDLGAVTLRVRSSSPPLAAPLAAAHRHQPLATEAAWIDFHVAVTPGAPWRRWLRPQADFACDAGRPFSPFPASHALPLFEWATNWLIGQQCAHLLLLHAGVVERGGRALVMPATPGSGKSTLTAALAQRGWRLLSDEFGAWDPRRSAFVPMLKPVALKNASIDVIRAFAPGAPIGPAFPKTRKGTVAHLAASAESVARRHEPAVPGAFVLPRWEDGAATRLVPLEPTDLFGALAFNAFNFRLLGADGFDAVLRLTRSCPAWRLVYSDLADALRAIDAHWPADPAA